MPSGTVTFERKVCHDFPIWNKSPCKISGMHATSHGLIEDSGKGMLQMDFANKFIGGGVLSTGLVQEEILFTIFPELIVSRLFCEMLEDNECVNIIGKLLWNVIFFIISNHTGVFYYFIRRGKIFKLLGLFTKLQI